VRKLTLLAAILTGLWACGDAGISDSGSDTAGSGGSGGTTGSGGITGSGGTAGTGGDAGQAGTGGTAGVGEGEIPIFVAQGHAGRRVASCDGGQTWVADQSKDDSIRCWVGGDPNEVECDHNEWPGYGVQFGGGYFWTTFGWGTEGPTMRSTNGVDWVNLNLVGTYGGLVFGEGRVLAATRYAKYSDDLGQTWHDTASVPLDGWNVRSAGYGGGTFYMAASGSNGNEMVYSDDGVSWSKPESAPAGCGGGGSFAYGNGIMIWMNGSSGAPCVTSDNGRNWTQNNIGENASSVVFNGTHFMVWQSGKRHRSADGVNWTTTDMNPNLSLEHAAVADDGSAYVGVKQSWGNYYDQQEFYYSSDGINWTESSSYTGGHPVRSMAFGRGATSTLCSGN